MQSDGGLTSTDRFIGSRAMLSGPAGGVVGYAMTTSEEEEGPVIGFDMGGTSTDVSRFDGDYEHVFESTTAGVAIQAPQVCTSLAPQVCFSPIVLIAEIPANQRHEVNSYHHSLFHISQGKDVFLEPND